jgi:hypothetical protein
LTRPEPVFIININKKKAVKRKSTRRVKRREEPFAARLHERSAEAAFELWTERARSQVRFIGVSAVTGNAVCGFIQVPDECGIFSEFRW